MLRFYATVIWF